jgi:hypothetical protein
VLENFTGLTYNKIMFNLIPISLLIIALGGIIYIASNHLSRLDEENEIDDVNFGLKAKFTEWANRMPVEKIKSQSLVLTRKTLHKTRLTLLKADNYLTKLIGKISEKDKQMNNDGINIENKNSIENNPNFWDNFSNEKKDVILASEEFIKPIETPHVDSLSKKKTVRAPRIKKTVK